MHRCPAITAHHADLTIDTPGQSFVLTRGGDTLDTDIVGGTTAISSDQAVNNVTVDANAVLAMTGANAALSANSVTVAGQLQHFNGSLTTPTIDIDAGVTGTFNDAGLFAEDAGTGHTNTIGMTLVNDGMTFDLRSGTVYIFNVLISTAPFQGDGTNGTLEIPSYTTHAGAVTQTGGRPHPTRVPACPRQFPDTERGSRAQPSLSRHFDSPTRRHSTMMPPCDRSPSASSAAASAGAPPR